jgi:RecQ family ATP-dependent DNA helicase
VCDFVSLNSIEITSFLEVAKLNGRSSGADIAAFLGSSQSDPMVEERALNGEYRLIYVTPEKLTSGGGFLDRLSSMHQSGNNKSTICLFAVDESHCVSEWGHDFRPSFLKIGPTLRNHPILKNIPILALTATAVPRVQSDIVNKLCMQPYPTIAKKSFDRPNLKITIRRKPRNGPVGAFEGLAKEMASSIASNKSVVGSGKSTIVYCSTKKEVEDTTAMLVRLLAHHLVTPAITLEHASQLASSIVRPYHAGLTYEQRTEAHTEFLVGKVAIIVATVAFGMGIDKPDIRRVIHWGACKTVEEYYQQMGRAGRDGLPAECIMYADSHDFAKYKDDFYLGGLSGEVKIVTVQSMDALRDFAMSTDGCRRAALLNFFNEVPSFGKFCGTCDLCLDRKNYGDDQSRDFQWEGARVILCAVAYCPSQVSLSIAILSISLTCFSRVSSSQLIGDEYY